MTEKASSKNWLKDNKNKLLKAGAVIAVGSLALTGCKAGAETTPTPPPTPPIEQTPPETPTQPETPTPPAETAPTSPETDFTYEVKLQDSEIYQGLSSAERKKIDKAVTTKNIVEYEKVDPDLRNLISYVVFDAAWDHYADRMKDVQVGDEGTASNTNGVNLLQMYHDMIMNVDPLDDIVSKDFEKSVYEKQPNREGSILYMGKDIDPNDDMPGYMPAEQIAGLTEQLFVAVAKDMVKAAANEKEKNGTDNWHNDNLALAIYMTYGLYHDGDRVVDRAYRLHDDLVMQFSEPESNPYDAMANWPDLNYVSRALGETDNNQPTDRVRIVLVHGDGPDLLDEGVDPIGDVVSYSNYTRERTTTYTGKNGKVKKLARLEITDKADGSTPPLGTVPYDN